MRAFSLFIGVWLTFGILCGFAVEARLRTVRGEQFAGVLRWESNGVQIINVDSGLIRWVPLQDLRRLLIDTASPSDPMTPVTRASLELVEGLPFPWEAGTIGKPAGPAESSWRDEVFRIETQGAVLGQDVESGRIIFERIRGDREIQTRLGRQTASQDDTRAGLIFRNSLDAISPSVFWGAAAGLREDVLEWRSQGGSPNRCAFPAVYGQRWYKLKRSGDVFSAYRSRDGQRWMLMCRTNVDLPRDLLVGVAAAGPSNFRVHRAPFERLSHAQRMEAAAMIQVELKGGSVIACKALEVEGGVLRFSGLESRPRVRVEDVARLVYQTLSTRAERRLQSGQHGVLLTTGDFIEGEPTRLIEGWLTLDSVLFGRRRVDVVNEAVAISLAVPQRADARYEITLVDGSVFRARDIALDGYRLRLEEPTLGSCTLPLAELALVERVFE